MQTEMPVLHMFDSSVVVGLILRFLSRPLREHHRNIEGKRTTDYFSDFTVSICEKVNKMAYHFFMDSDTDEGVVEEFQFSFTNRMSFHK